MFSIVLMFIGAAPGSTGGGIKGYHHGDHRHDRCFDYPRQREEPSRPQKRPHLQQMWFIVPSPFLFWVSIVVVSVTSIILMTTNPLEQNSFPVSMRYLRRCPLLRPVGLSAGVTGIYLGNFTGCSDSGNVYRQGVGPVSFGLSALSAQQSNQQKLVMPEGRLSLDNLLS